MRIIQFGSIFEKKDPRLRGQQSNLTRININHSSFTRLFTRPTLQQPPGATLETTLAWSQSVADYNVPSEVFHFQTFHSQRSPRHAPNWFHIAELFHFWTGWLRVSIIFGMNTGCVLIIWIFFFNIFIWKCKNAHCYVTWLTGNLLIFNYNLHVTLMCCIYFMQ